MSEAEADRQLEKRVEREREDWSVSTAGGNADSDR